MAYSLKYFMWGFQSHLESELRHLARNLFSGLGCQVHPIVFLVGMRTGEGEGDLPVCVEPEDCHLQPEQFDDLSRRIDVELKAPRSTFRIHSSESIAKRYETSDYRSAVSTAVEEIVRSATGDDQWVTYCSHARPVNNYLVVAVLQLDRRAVDAWASLSRETRDGMRVCRSLIESTAWAFVDHCANALSVPDPGEDIGQSKRPDELLRSAGRRFGYTAAHAGGNMHGLHTFFDACNVLSSLRYEGGVGRGSLVVARPSHPALRPALLFARPVQLTDYHAARKLLELASDDTYVFSDASEVYGVGGLGRDVESHLEDLFVVKFTGHHVWELWQAGCCLMRVAHNEPRLPQRRLDLPRFLDIVMRVVEGMTEDDARYIAQLIGVAIELGRGALIVIASDAEEQASRLERQAIRVHPVRMTEDMLRRASGIDGAVLLDATATCHAIGAILDGAAHRNASMARGSRYNSAVRYVHNWPGKVAVVVSADGMVDVLPNLPPRIHRRDLDKRLTDLREMVGGEEVERQALYAAEEWLRRHVRYLTAAECEEASRLIGSGKDKCQDGGVRVDFGPLVPDEDLSELYFYRESSEANRQR